MSLRELGLFAGAGGGLLASRLLGWRTVCAVEIDAHCQRVLAQRQRDGHLEQFPIEMLRVIGEVRPAFVFAENSPWLRTRGLDVVLGGLADMGFDAAWGVLGARHVGAPHKRDRMWIVAAHPDRCRQRGLTEHAEVASAPSARADAADADGNALREQPGGAAGRTGPKRLSLEGQTGGVWIALREWMMGWPLGWSASEPLATDRFREWLRSHGAF